MQGNVGTVSQQHPSPQSSPEVNVTCSIQPDIEDHMNTQIIGSGDQSNDLIGDHLTSGNEGLGSVTQITIDEDTEFLEMGENEVTYYTCTSIFCP